MAYPFIFFPTWREVIDRLQREHQIPFKQDGDVRYFERKSDKLPVIVDFADDQNRPVPSEMRSLCENLEISPKFFGLTLPEPDWAEED